MNRHQRTVFAASVAIPLCFVLFVAVDYLIDGSLKEALIQVSLAFAIVFGVIAIESLVLLWIERGEK